MSKIRKVRSPHAGMFQSGCKLGAVCMWEMKTREKGGADFFRVNSICPAMSAINTCHVFSLPKK